MGNTVAIHRCMAKNEPQSYGSEKEWLTGDTGQAVNRL